MATINDTIINQMTECIVKEVNPVRIILFGSSVRCHVHEDSDIDLLVIEDAPFGEGRSRFRETGVTTGYLLVLVLQRIFLSIRLTRLNAGATP